MSIEVLTGLPGSGKSAEIIRRTNALRAQQANVFLLAMPSQHVASGDTQHRHIASRNGTSALLDAIAEPDEIAALITDKAEPETTFLFDDAQVFPETIVDAWKAASEAGSTVIVACPSHAQQSLLKAHGANIRKMSKRCDLLADGEASQFFIMPGSNATISVCDRCATALQTRAATGLREQLIAMEPYPGNERIYQPIPVALPEFEDLKPIREDSETRVELMREAIEKHIGAFPSRSRTYCDIGCNTGYFCKAMGDLGFTATGVDVVEDSINMGKALDTFFYRRHIDFRCQDALEFVADMNAFDVVSTFSVFQWIFTQHADQSAVRQAMLRMMSKARKLFFFEMGYQNEAHYREALAEPIDRTWCEKLLSEAGFSAVVLVPKAHAVSSAIYSSAYAEWPPHAGRFTLRGRRASVRRFLPMMRTQDELNQRTIAGQ